MVKLQMLKTKPCAAVGDSTLLGCYFTAIPSAEYHAGFTIRHSLIAGHVDNVDGPPL